MEIKAKAKYLKISPQKVRRIAFQFKNKNAQKSLEELNTLSQKSAFLIAKLIKSATANAENNFNLKKDDLVISQIIVEEGPLYKRMKPRARGGRDIIKKRTSHIIIILSSKEIPKAKNKKEEIEKPVKIDMSKKENQPKMIEKAAKKPEKKSTKKKTPKKKLEKAVEKTSKTSKEEIKETEKPKVTEREKQPLKEKRPFFQRFFRRKGGE